MSAYQLFLCGSSVETTSSDIWLHRAHRATTQGVMQGSARAGIGIQVRVTRHSLRQTLTCPRFSARGSSGGGEMADKDFPGGRTTVPKNKVQEFSRDPLVIQGGQNLGILKEYPIGKKAGFHYVVQ